MKRLRLSTWALFGGLALSCGSASAAEPFTVVDQYVAQLTANAESSPSNGPDQYLLSWTLNGTGITTPVPTPIAGLVKNLKDCSITNKGYNYGKPGYPKWVAGYFSWECPSASPENRAVRVTVITSLDGGSVALVEVVLGGEVS
ncbi:MAG: hypothetical protein ABI240_13530, partial [Sphingomonas sp.]